MLIMIILAVGLAAGWAAQLLLGRRRIDWQLALISGLIGSLVGGTLASLIAGDGFDIKPSGIIGSIVGAVIVVAIVGAVRGRSRA